MESKKINHLKIPTFEDTQKIKEEKVRHAKRAFYRRFNYSLSDQEFADISSIVTCLEAEVVMWQKHHGSVVKVRWKEFEFFAVYGHKLECIVTFLSLDMTPKFFDVD